MTPLAGDSRHIRGSRGGGEAAGRGKGGASPLQPPVCRVSQDSGTDAGDWHSAEGQNSTLQCIGHQDDICIMLMKMVTCTSCLEA